MIDSTGLTVSDFPAWFRAVHGGYEPFPWQTRLLRHVVEHGRWPALLDLPTGSGKTAALDVALFHLALDAGGERRAPVRIVFVVDRRVVVDQAFTRAVRIREALDSLAESHPVVAAVRSRLASLSVEGKPLHTSVLRGGIAREDVWARSPDQPSIVVSTVDQVGSRLLFRGYGVSNSMRPVHAGLLGNDALFLLDEVQLSVPFCETLMALEERYLSPRMTPLPRRWQAVRMSATVGVEKVGAWGLSPEEDAVDPVLRRRLEARKPVVMQEIRTAGDAGARLEAFARGCCEAVVPWLAPGMAGAIVVNRVQSARTVYAQLRREVGERADVVLLTGRMRPIDRDEILAAVEPRIRAGRTRTGDERPIVIVSTQCIEAGADFDFDGLVTECASLDALRQRFGRLNRFGDAVVCRGMILAQSSSLKEEDPIYGMALRKTWEWLSGRGSLDFGITSLQEPEGDALAPLLAPRDHAPTLLPSYLNAWVQTAPVPEPDPEVALWLHGPRRGEPEVQVAWRADLDIEMLEKASKDEGIATAVIARVEACPPAAPEIMSLPLRIVQEWLRGKVTSSDFGDVEGAALSAGDGKGDARPVLAWRGEKSRMVAAGEIRPNDTLVLPSCYGGLSAGNWDPGSVDAVPDLGDRAGLMSRGRPVLRVNSAVLGETAAGVTVPAPGPRDDPETDDQEAVRGWLERVLASSGLPDWMVGSARHLLRGLERRRARILRMPRTAGDGQDEYFTLVGTFKIRGANGGGAGDTSTEGDAGAFSGVPVPLKEHLDGVASWAHEFGLRCGLPREVVDDLTVAAAWHDVGKIDPRCQCMLHGGSRFKAATAEAPLAKSGMSSYDRRAREAARQRSGYPRGTRHELMSLTLLEPATWVHVHDRDLVLHLVASHHGECRPLAPFVADDEPVDLTLGIEGRVVRANSRHDLARLDSGVSDRFWRLVRRYGWFGLAWLESMLRLADHRRSEEEAERL